MYSSHRDASSASSSPNVSSTWIREVYSTRLGRRLERSPRPHTPSRTSERRAMSHAATATTATTARVGTVRRRDDRARRARTRARATSEENVHVTRRDALSTAVALAVTLVAPDARAIGFKKELKKREPSSGASLDAETAPFEFRGEPHRGVAYSDLVEGKGKALESGALATLHFECKFRGLTVSSTREARTLGGNRTISEPFQFKYGTLPNEFTKAAKRKNVIGVGMEVRIDPDLKELYVVKCVFNGPADRAGIKPNDVILAIDGAGDLVDKPIQEIGALLTGDVGTEVRLKIKKGGSRNGPDAPVEEVTLTREITAVATPKREVQVEGGGGLFTGGSGPKPPPLIYVPEALEGMKVGGRRKFIVPSDVGFEDVGEGEIPPGATFELIVDLLDVETR